LNLLNKQNKRIRGILFDKDGTLIDFNSIWIPLAFELTSKLFFKYQILPKQKAVLLDRIGVSPDGNMVSGSIYASGTEDDLAKALYQSGKEMGICLPDYNFFLECIQSEVKTYMQAHRSQIRPVPHAGRTLAALKNMGLTLGISTSDNEENTRICLEETGLLKYFQYIGCPGDSKSPKPSGDILLDFSAKFGIKPEEVAVVGDTSVDIAFAKQNHAGLAIGVLSGAGNREDFKENADYVFSSIAGLLDDRLPIWEA